MFEIDQEGPGSGPGPLDQDGPGPIWAHMGTIQAQKGPKGPCGSHRAHMAVTMPLDVGECERMSVNVSKYGIRMSVNVGKCK